MNSLTAKICSQIFLEVIFLIKIVGNLRETRACKPSNIKKLGIEKHYLFSW